MRLAFALLGCLAATGVATASASTVTKFRRIGPQGGRMPVPLAVPPVARLVVGRPAASCEPRGVRPFGSQFPELTRPRPATSHRAGLSRNCCVRAWLRTKICSDDLPVYAIWQNVVTTGGLYLSASHP